MIPKNRTAFHLFLYLALLLLIGTAYVFALHDGHDWKHGDFSMYIQHARNLVNGDPYSQSGYLHNPWNQSKGPQTYPPVFPALLAPVYALFGLNLIAMKIELIFIFLACLLLFPWIFSPDLTYREHLLMLLIIGFNPYVFTFTNYILSDIPFLFFVYLSLGYVHHLSRRQQCFNHVHSAQSLLTGCLLYLAYGTRSIGLILLPVLILYNLLVTKKFPWFSLQATCSFSVLAAIQMIFFHTEQGYLSQWSLHLTDLKYNIIHYARALAMLWDNGYTPLFRNLLFYGTSLLALLGFLVKHKHQTTIFDLFALLYMVPVILWPSTQGTRFLIPIIPLYIFYLLFALSPQGIFTSQHNRTIALTIVLALLGISYMGKYSSIEGAALTKGIYSPESIELIEYIQTTTEPDDVLICWKPRIFSLLTGRKASSYHQPQDIQQLWRYFQKIHASYLIDSPEDPPYIKRMLSNFHENLEITFANSDFHLYKINGKN